MSLSQRAAPCSLPAPPKGPAHACLVSDKQTGRGILLALKGLRLGGPSRPGWSQDTPRAVPLGTVGQRLLRWPPGLRTKGWGAVRVTESPREGRQGHQP